MNTAIEGAKTPAEIMKRTAAAKLATAQTGTEAWKPGVLHEQASDLASSAVLKDAQRAKTKVDTENAKYGSQVEQFRRLAERAILLPCLACLVSVLPPWVSFSVAIVFVNINLVVDPSTSTFGK